MPLASAGSLVPMGLYACMCVVVSVITVLRNAQ